MSKFFHRVTYSVHHSFHSEEFVPSFTLAFLKLTFSMSYQARNKKKRKGKNVRTFFSSFRPFLLSIFPSYTLACSKDFSIKGTYTTILKAFCWGFVRKNSIHTFYNKHVVLNSEFMNGTTAKNLPMVYVWVLIAKNVVLPILFISWSKRKGWWCTLFLRNKNFHREKESSPNVGMEFVNMTNHSKESLYSFRPSPVYVSASITFPIDNPIKPYIYIGPVAYRKWRYYSTDTILKSCQIVSVKECEWTLQPFY